MSIQYYNEQPEPFETIRSMGIMTTVIRLDVKETETAASEEHARWQCEEVEYNHREPLTRDKDRSAIITALVRARYTADQMEAIINNYILDPDSFREEMMAMQAWRSQAKSVADAVLGTLCP